MKLLLFFSLVTLSFSSFAQYPDEVQLQEIITEIATPLDAGDQDLLLQRVYFPFEVGDKIYSSKSKLISSFNNVFIEDYKACLMDPDRYQMALMNDHTWYLAVCYSAPEGYNATVFSFKKINGKWMLDSIDLQVD